MQKHGPSGFFGILLESELAGIIKADVRKAWERKYPFVDEVVEQPKTAKKRGVPDTQAPGTDK
jgi:hypothetical protein